MRKKNSLLAIVCALMLLVSGIFIGSFASGDSPGMGPAESAPFRQGNVFDEANTNYEHRPITGSGEIILGNTLIGTTPTPQPLRINSYRSTNNASGPFNFSSRTPMFYDHQMNRIRYNQLPTQNNLGEPINYGFAMLEHNVNMPAPNHPTHFVMVEILNVNAVGAGRIEFTPSGGATETITNFNTIDRSFDELEMRRNAGGMGARENMVHFNHGVRESLIGVFTREGHYTFHFEITTRGVTNQVRTITFSFYIAHAHYYNVVNQPVFAEADVLTGPITATNASTFFYNFGGPYPNITYNPSRFSLSGRSTTNFNVGQGDFVDEHGRPSTVGLPDSVPAARGAQQGQTLAEIELLPGWNWVAPVTTTVGIGPHQDHDARHPQSGRVVSVRIYITSLPVAGDRIFRNTRTFRDLGLYELRTNIIFTHQGHGTRPTRVVSAGPRFTSFDYSLQIFGYQAFYENYEDFGGGQLPFFNEDYNADISAWAESFSNQVALRNAVDAQRAMTTGRTLFPVTTNAPPVQIWGNGTLDEAFVWVNTGQGWVQQTFVRDRPFTAPGEYLITKYYTFPIANPVGALTDVEFRQVFYFRIINHFDIRVQAGTGPAVPLSQFIGNRMYTSEDGFFVYVDGVNTANDVTRDPSPFIIEPSFRLSIHDFGVEAPRQVVTGPDVLAMDTFPDLGDGEYRFTITYGIRNRVIVEFRVIVDRTKIQDFDISTYGIVADMGNFNVSNQFALVGPGQAEDFNVTLSWGAKPSGARFTEAILYHFPFIDGRLGFNQLGGTGILGTDTTALLSPWQMSSLSPTRRVTTDIRRLPDGRFALAPFTLTGVHIAAVRDSAGNDSYFMLIIDDTGSAVAQAPLPQVIGGRAVNITHTDTRVGFGRYRVVESNLRTQLSTLLVRPTDEQSLGTYWTDLLSQLQTWGLFQEGRGAVGPRTGLAVPIQTIAIATENRPEAFHNIYNRARNITHPPLPGNVFTTTAHGAPILGVLPSVNNHIAQLNHDNDYFFRITDVIGNVTYYRVIRTSDQSRGTIIGDNLDSQNNPWTPTATIVPSGSITNQRFVTFAFEQQGAQNHAHFVESIDIEFYPLNRQEFLFNSENEPTATPNPNYPFAAESEWNVLGAYDYTLDSDTSHNWRFVQINRGDEGGATEEGIYIITRHFRNVSGAAGTLEHLLIVDRNSVINPDFETGITIRMGDKVASWQHFQTADNYEMLTPRYRVTDGDGYRQGERYNRDHIIQTNTQVTIQLPSPATKYGGPINKTLGGSVRQLTALRITTRVEFWPAGVSTNAAPEILTGNTFTLPGIYRVSFQDTSRSNNWQTHAQVGYGNRSQVLFEIVGTRPVADFFHNSRRVDTSSIRFAPGDTLIFRYTTDNPQHLPPIMNPGNPYNFLATIDSLATTLQRGVVGGNMAPIANMNLIRTQVINDNQITVTYMLTSLEAISDRDVFEFTVRTRNNILSPDSFRLTIDNTPPRYNLNEIILHDTFFNLSGRPDYDFEAGRGNYVFAVHPLFEFTRPNVPSENPDHDAFRISWQEVSSTLATISVPVWFNYSTPQSRITIGQVVNFRETENRFFLITEFDEAGNTSMYYIQLRGDLYDEQILAFGLSHDVRYGNNLLFNYNERGLPWEIGVGVFGTDIHVADASGFWEDNPYFEIRFQNRFYRRVGNVAFTDLSTTPSPARLHEFENALRSWIRSTPIGVIDLLINNRQTIRTHRIYQITADAVETQLSMTVTGSNLVLGIDNIMDVPELVFTLPMWVTVYDSVSGSGLGVPKTGYNRRQIVGGSLAISGSVERELLLVIEDPFGRRTIVEHNGVHGNVHAINFSGNTRTIQEDGIDVIYTGDPSGVEIRFTPNVHMIRIMNENGVVAGLHPQVTPGTPNAAGVATTIIRQGAASQWRVEIISRAKDIANYRGRIIAAADFVFYPYIPQLRFTNLNGDPITDIEGAQIPGIVQVHYDNQGFRFGSTIWFYRYFNNPNYGQASASGEVDDRMELRDRVTIGRNVTTFQLNQVGRYVLHVRNEVWATEMFSFEITDVDNITYAVTFDEGGDEPRRLVATPDGFRDISFQGGRVIPHYIVVGQVGDISNLSGPLSITPSINYPREILGAGDVPNTFFHRVGPILPTNTYIYRLVSLNTGGEIFIAISNILPTASLDLILPQFSGANPTQFSQDLFNQPGRATFLEFHTIPNDGLTVGLPASHWFNNPSVLWTNQGFGNRVYMEYYYNIHPDEAAEPTGIILSGETLTIRAENYGIFWFVIRDWAGNRRIFDAFEAAVPYFTMYNLARPPILLNGETIVSGMVVNDVIVFETMDIPPAHRTVASINNHHFVNSIYVRMNDELTPTQHLSQNTWHDQTRWVFAAPGTYEFIITYMPHGNPLLASRIQFTVHLVSSTINVPAFSYAAPHNIEIVGIVNADSGMNYRNRFEPGRLDHINLDGQGFQGNFRVTLRFAADNVRDSFTRSFSVLVLDQPRFENVIRLPGGIRASTVTGTVSVGWTPLEIFGRYQDSEVRIYRNGQLYFRRAVNSAIVAHHEELFRQTGDQRNRNATQPLSEAGTYRVVLLTEDQGVRFSEIFEIREPMSGITVLLIIILIALVVGGVAVFIHLRTRMRVR